MGNGRAVKGGERGVNGEWYEGGKFLPSTQAPKRKGSAPKRGSRRVEVEPGVWVEATDGRMAVWGAISSVVDNIARFANPSAPLVGTAAAVEYYGPKMQEMIDAYNRGERWYQP